MRALSTIPKDASPIMVKLKTGKTVKAYYVDCHWLREGHDGDPEVQDCLRLWDDNEHFTTDDIELEEVTGWKPCQ